MMPLMLCSLKSLVATNRAIVLSEEHGRINHAAASTRRVGSHR